MIIIKVRNALQNQDLMSSYMMQSSVIVSGFFTMIFINRNLGIEVYGIYMIILSIVSILSNIITARGLEVIPKFYVREYDKQKYELARLTLTIGVLIDLVSSLVLFTFIYLTADFFVDYFIKDNQYTSLVLIYSAVAIIGYFKNTPNGYFIAKKNFKFYNNLIIFENTLKILVVEICLCFFDFNLKNLVYGFVIAAILSSLTSFYFFVKTIDENILKVKIRKDITFIKEYLYFNLNTFSSSMLKAGNQNIDNLILSYFVNPVSVGLYQTIKKFFVPMQFIASPFATLNYPIYLKFYENEQYKELKVSITNITKNIISISLIYGIIILILLPYLLLVMNISYSIDIFISSVLMFLYLFLINYGWWNRMLSMVVNPSISLISTVYLTIGTLTLSVYSTYLYELNGLLISYILMFLSIQIFYIHYYRKKL